MAIQDVLRKAGPYDWATSRSYPFSFKIFSASNVTVTVSRDGVESVLDDDAFSVSLNGDQDNNPGGAVVLNASVAVADKVVITSAVPYTQEMALTNQGGFYPAILNDNSDRIVAQIQQLKEGLSRAIKVGVTSSTSAEQYKAELEEVADSAAASAASAAQSASQAQTLANEANTKAGTALSNSQEAVSTANAASSAADKAVADASNAVSTANAANAASAAAVADVSEALRTANAASLNASEAKTDAQSALSTVTALQEGLPQDVSDEVSKQLSEELEETVKSIVTVVAPPLIEEQVDESYAKKEDVSDAVAGEASLRESADTALGSRIDNIGSSLATVATTGAYADLTGTPKKVSAFENDIPYATKAELDAKDSLPDQSGNNGKFLSTNGSSASWATVDPFPSQTGNDGKFLTTSGQSVYWEDILDGVSVNSTGSGNAVTDVTASGSAITVTKGASYVPTSRTVNGKALSSDITIGSSDISGFVKTDNGSLAVGSCILGFQVTTAIGQTVSCDNNSTIAGSKIAAYGSGSSSTFSGTWRNISGANLMSHQKGLDNTPSYTDYGLFQRIS